jgi:diacylglycerol kinase family enzyme
VELEWRPTEGPGHATELARRAAEEGHPLVLAFGGDGTYNEAARGLLGSPSALGILPGGTTSVLAYELGIPQRVEAALPLVLGGEDRRVAVGRTDKDQIFLLMLSCGPDAVILERLPAPLKRYGGKAGITLQAVREFVRGELPRVRVVLDGGRANEEAGWVIAGNAASYGGPFPGAPGASLLEEDLVVVVQRRVGRLAAVPFFFAIPRGSHVCRPDVTVHRCRSLHLHSDACDGVPYQLDGDPAGTLPVSARVEPGALLLRFPCPGSQSGSENSAVEM